MDVEIDENGLRQGIAREHTNDEIVIIDRYIDDKIHGSRKVYNDGILKTEAVFRHGELKEFITYYTKLYCNTCNAKEKSACFCDFNLIL